MTDHRALALYAESAHNRARLRAAAERLGLRVVDLPKDPRDPLPDARADLAWRAPLGLMAALLVRGVPLRVTAPGPQWFASLPAEALARRVAVVDATSLTSGEIDFVARLVKLADAKLPGFSATRTRHTEHAAQLVRAARLPADALLLVADQWLDCHSEYRVFCIAREPVAWSPYLVEGEGWSPLLQRHRASFHERAASFAGDVLAGLAVGQVPPACVLDIARLEDGRMVVLEANTAWGAGLYGCDPDAVLAAVLAANDPADEPADDQWLWTPDPVMVQQVAEHRDPVVDG